jgi:hypothetical protein
VLPWVGVVSLYEMLEFSAEAYVDIAHQLGEIIGSLKARESSNYDLNKAFNRILDDAQSLGLLVTRDQVATMILEMIKKDPQKSSLSQGVLSIHAQDIDPSRLLHHAEAVLSVLKSELRVIKFRAIPREKDKYCDPKWQAEGPLFEKYSDTVDELQRAGRCFSYGENTACIFHLMRVTDFFLKKVGQSAGVDYDSNNWAGIAQGLTKKMEQKYQTKSDDWKQREPFFAEVLTDIQAIGRGHRNQVLHELEKKYDEREALYMLTVIEAFAVRVSGKL